MTVFSTDALAGGLSARELAAADPAERALLAMVEVVVADWTRRNITYCREYLRYARAGFTLACARLKRASIIPGRLE
jgi:hypothetical protein